MVELTTDTEVDSRIFENFVDDWAKSSNFNDIKPKNSLLILLLMSLMVKSKKIAEYKSAKQSISDFCFGNNITSTPYIRMLDSGKTVSEIMAVITEDVLLRSNVKKLRKSEKRLKNRDKLNLTNNSKNTKQENLKNHLMLCPLMLAKKTQEHYLNQK